MAFGAWLDFPRDGPRRGWRLEHGSTNPVMALRILKSGILLWNISGHLIRHVVKLWVSLETHFLPHGWRLEHGSLTP